MLDLLYFQQLISLSRKNIHGQRGFAEMTSKNLKSSLLIEINAFLN
jgi:hypothetical protein